jgi:NitT/TauT family transport system substrate-binding protein
MMVMVRHKPAGRFMLLVPFILAVLAILVGAGCTQEPQAPLRVGTNVWPGYEPLYLARDQGYYPPESVRLVEYTSASEVIRAFRNGAIDAAALTIDEVLLLAETAPDVSVVLVLDVSHGADVILAQPALSGLRDLKGKRVGVEATALGAYILTRALQTVDLTPADVQTVSLEVSEHERAFKEGRVDAVVTFEPVRTKLLAVGARQVFDSTRLPGEIVDVLVVRRASSAKQGAQIGQLVRGWFRALDFIRKDPDRTASLMAPREHLSADDFRKALQGLRLPDIDEDRSMLAGPAPALIPPIQQLSRVMQANQLIKRPPELNGLLDGRFVEGAGSP